MTDQEYLQAVLEDQRLTDDSPEVARLERIRNDVADLLADEFGSGPELREGGSKAKGTMIREDHDLDLPYYVANDDTSVGDTIKEIYENVEAALQTAYKTERKGVAVRLLDAEEGSDLSVDVIPGRFTNGDGGDAFLFPSSTTKERVQTNLETHVSHVRNSGVVDAICLMKLWRTRRGIEVKTFALELLTIDQLQGQASSSLPDQLTRVWTEFRDRMDELTITDPANEHGNDLADMLDSIVRERLKSEADDSLKTVEAEGWTAVFGPLGPDEESDRARTDALRRVATAAPPLVKPWAQ